MRQPEITKAHILKESGTLFNTQGYKATSISDITGAAQLTKGAIYRHFKNKDELEKEALSYLSNTMFELVRHAIKSKTTAPEKLKAIFRFFETYISNPPIPGGCPLLNVAPEVDDAHPMLRKQALAVLETLHASLVHILAKGVEHGQIKPDTNKADYATMVIAMLEGAIMMSKLRGNNQDILTAIAYLEKLTEEITT